MALAVPSANNRKRVKVYELKQTDWYDRGTGFCSGAYVDDEAHLMVISEDEPTRELLQTQICKDDGYQKQQATLIVWTESSGTDMALSFQEADGCASIWEFISEVQSRLNLTGPGKHHPRYVRNAGVAEGSYDALDDSLSDNAIDGNHPVVLPLPELGNLQEVDSIVRVANSTQQGRDSLSKFIIGQDYIAKLVPLVEIAEDLESLPDLHRLCNIMKIIILLNDNAIIEHIVTDEMILGVVGALEYDPDFPSHKANHRQYLSDESRFKEVVRIDDPGVKTKIHYIYRLQYLKDVVLARILDDPTFSVLHSLIFYHQVDIVQHIQENSAFLAELFGIFSLGYQEAQRKKDAVLFIQQCSAIARGLQIQARASLYQNFMAHGLFNVIAFALRHADASIRVAGTDVLVALIDHDAAAIRGHIFKAINERTKPLTDTLIELLLVEVDLGVKAQIADVIKVLLDPNANTATVETVTKQNAEYVAKLRSNPPVVPQTEGFIQNFYDGSARKLFQPLKDLENRRQLKNLTIQEVSLYSHLVEILCFFVRQHTVRSKYFILSEDLASRIAQLLSCPEKHLKLCALKYFRACVGLNDEFHNRLIIHNNLLEPILDIVIETMPKDNLLNSACLELFEFIKRDTLKPMINYVVENYREKIEDITYVDTFQSLIFRYEQIHGLHPDPDQSFTTVDADTPNRNIINGGQRWQGLKDADAEEEAYFNSSDNEDEDETLPGTPLSSKHLTNGASPVRPLVDYPADDEDDEDHAGGMDILSQIPDITNVQHSKQPNSHTNDNPDPTTNNSRDNIVLHNSSGDSYSYSPSRNAAQKHHSFISRISVSSPNSSDPHITDVTNSAMFSSVSPSGHAPSAAAAAENMSASTPSPLSRTARPSRTPPPERLSEKRRREEDDDEDELGKLSAGPKKRSASIGHAGAAALQNTVQSLRRKKSMNAVASGGDGGGSGGRKDGGKERGKESGIKKIAISLGMNGGRGGEERKAKGADGGGERGGSRRGDGDNG